jgi:hypothetical protein
MSVRLTVHPQGTTLFHWRYFHNFRTQDIYQAFECLQNCEKLNTSFAISVRLTVHPQGTTLFHWRDFHNFGTQDTYQAFESFHFHTFVSAAISLVYELRHS